MQGQGHRPKAKAKAENAKVIFPVNAKVNPVFQFRDILSWFQATAAITTAIK